MRRALAKTVSDSLQLLPTSTGVKFATSSSTSSTKAAASEAYSAIKERILSSSNASTSGRLLFYSQQVPRHQCLWQTTNSSRQYSSWRPFSDVVPKKWSLRQVADHMGLLKPSYEYILGTGYNARIAIINALYAMQPSTHWARMISLLMAEAVTRGDPTAWCFKIPITEQELLHLEEAEAADAVSTMKTQRNVIKRIINNTIRLMWLSMLFTPVVLWAPFAFGYNLGRKKWMKLLRTTLEISGPAFIKWGQWAATRHDLFPPDFCDELERLHTSAPAHGEYFTRAAISFAFGFTVEDLFSEFDAVPVASGSIGQIHRAKLSPTGARLTGMSEGTLVAVKVRHPGVSEAIERDFALMMVAAKVAAMLPALKTLRLEESLSQFAAPLREQVDLGREAYHLHAFNYNFRAIKGVAFPIPLYPLAAPSVLVETFESGEHIGKYVSRGPGAPHNSVLAQLGAHSMLRMMIVDNLIHADLHPGNILVRLEPVGGSVGSTVRSTLMKATENIKSITGWDVTLPEDFLLRPKMIFLDAGMATHLYPQDQVNMVGLFEAFSRLDGRSIAAWTLRFAGEEQTCPDPEGFQDAVETKFNALKEQQAFVKGDTSNGAEALADVLEDVRNFQVNLPGHIVATVVTTLILEGWSFNLDPEHSTLEEVKRIIKAKRGETAFKRVAAWVASAAEREILEHVPKFEPAPVATTTLWAWLDSFKESSLYPSSVVGSSTGSDDSLGISGSGQVVLTGGKVRAVQ